MNDETENIPYITFVNTAKIMLYKISSHGHFGSSVLSQCYIKNLISVLYLKMTLKIA